MYSVEIVLDYLYRPPVEIFQLCKGVFSARGFNQSTYARGVGDGHLARLEHFRFGGTVFDSFDYCPLANHRLDLMTLDTGIDIEDLSILLGKLVEALDARQAFLHEADYYKWQNAQDPLIYRAAGRNFKHLPMVDNGLPAPLNQMVVDISANPGRRQLRDGYLEAVSSPMWLRLDWQVLPIATLERLASSTLETARHLLLIGPEQPCSRASAGYQTELRELIYGA